MPPLSSPPDKESSEIEEVLHDIKAPLSAIVAGLDLLDEQELSESSRDEVKRSLKLSAHTVVEMIEILSTARSLGQQNLSFNKEQIILADLLNEISTTHAPVFKAKNVELRVSPGSNMTKISGDSRALKRVFANLLSNSLRNSSPQSRVSINVARRGRQVVLTVTDEGPGFALERGTNGRYHSAAQGTGLGLTICKRIIEAHNGHMHISSAPGKGTSVALFLPQ